MESTARISTGFISLLALYKALIIFISSVIVETFKNELVTAELLSYKEVLYDEATEAWYAERDPDEVKREERNCMRLAQQFCHLMKEYREQSFTYVLFQPTTRSVSAHLESYLLHVHWIIRQRDYAQNKA